MTRPALCHFLAIAAFGFSRYPTSDMLWLSGKVSIGRWEKLLSPAPISAHGKHCSSGSSENYVPAELFSISRSRCNSVQFDGEVIVVLTFQWISARASWSDLSLHSRLRRPVLIRNCSSWDVTISVFTLSGIHRFVIEGIYVRIASCYGWFVPQPMLRASLLSCANLFHFSNAQRAGL